MVTPVSPRSFWLPRRGYAPGEYEDAFAADTVAGRFAVADGATEGCFTGLWARLLVDDFVTGAAPDVSAWPAAVPALQERWAADVEARPLPWYAESSVSQGAHAAFLGLAMAASADDFCQWQAVAVGDSCLLHSRGSALLRAFPLDRADLVGSRAPSDDVVARQRLWTDGRGRPGDRLWLMTDALAQWCLAQIEAGDNAWEDLERLLTADGEAFREWTERLRDAGGLRNDDVTLLAIPL